MASKFPLSMLILGLILCLRLHTQKKDIQDTFWHFFGEIGANLENSLRLSHLALAIDFWKTPVTPT